MKVRSVRANNRRKVFEAVIGRRLLSIPYARLEPQPTREDPVVRSFVDAELGREGFSYALRSGATGSVLADWILEYNRDPEYLRELLVYRLTLEARKRVDSSPVARREIIRRMKTSATQFYRVLDPTNSTKSIDQLLRLFYALDLDIDIAVQPKRSKTGQAA